MSEVGYLKLEFVSQGYTLVLTLLVRVVWVNFPEDRSMFAPEEQWSMGSVY